MILRRLLILAEALLLLGLLIARRYPERARAYLELNQELPTLLNFLGYLAVVDLARRLVRLSYARRHRLRRGRKTNFHYGVDNIAKLLVGLGVVVTVFALFGVDVRTLLTSMSIVAAAIAIISKEYVNDFLIGLYFSFSKDFEINDYVRLGEHKGKITELQMLKVRILNDDDDSVVIPNSKVYNNEITNYTKRDIRSLSVDFQVATQAVPSIEALERDLIAALADSADYIEPDSFFLRIVEMKKDTVDLKIHLTLRRFDRDTQRQIRKRVVRAVFNRLAGATP